MSATTRRPDADPLFAGPQPDRPYYATGMLLDAGDFLDEQTYHRGRLAEALLGLSGGGTVAGLRVSHRSAAEGAAEQIRVDAGMAIDCIGRTVVLRRTGCLRLERWWSAMLDQDGGDALVRSRYEDVQRFVSARTASEAGAGEAAPLPDRAVIADVFLRFVACPRGLTPSFASGPLDALDAATTSRLRDAHELLLVPREGLDDDFDGLPDPGPDLSEVTDVTERRAALEDAVLAAWSGSGTTGADKPQPGPQHPLGVDPTARLLARVLIPVTADSPPERDGVQVLVDNWVRRFAPSIHLLQRWLGL